MAQEDYVATIGNTPPGMSIWLRLAPDLQTNIWGYNPVIEPTQATSEELAELKRRGWAEIDAQQAAWNALFLAGQLAPMGRLSLASNRGVYTIIAEQGALERLKKRPVLLAFQLPDEMLQALAAINPNAQMIRIVLSLPPPVIGQIGLVQVEGGWRFYSIGNTGEKGMAIWKEMGEALKEYVKPAWWWEYTPDIWEACASPQTYQEVHDYLAHGFKRVQAKEHDQLRWSIRRLEEVKKQREQVQRAAERYKRNQVAQDAAWEEIRHMAGKLVDLYWKAHLERSRDTPPPVTPLAFKDGTAWGYMNAPLLTAMNGMHNAASGGSRWRQQTDDQTPYYEEESDKGVTTLSFKRPDSVTTDGTLSQALWEQLRSKSQDVDTLFAAMLHRANTPDSALIEGKYAAINPATLLDYRQIKPKTTLENGRKRRAGHREEDIQAVIDSMERLAWLWVDIKRIPKGQKKALVLQGRLIEIKHRWVQQTLQEDGTTSEQVTCWLYSLGSWLDAFDTGGPFKRQWGKYLQQVLSYNQHSQQWEKRLAHLFTFLLRFRAGDGSHILHRRVGDLIHECSLMENETYARRYPQNVLREPLERALNRLKTDGIIAHWRYLEDTNKLPEKGWVDAWLGCMVEVSIGPLLLESSEGQPGYREMIEGKNAHKAGQKGKNGKRQGRPPATE